jgi:hypothetical protein
VTPELATSWLSLPFAAGPFVSIRRVIEVSLDGCLCTTEPACDLGDREAFLVAIVARERYRPTALPNAVQSHHASDNTAVRRRDKVPASDRFMNLRRGRVWGRDELNTGDMWNSNAVIS